MNLMQFQRPGIKWNTVVLGWVVYLLPRGMGGINKQAKVKNVHKKKGI